MSREAGAGYALAGHMGIGGQKGVGVVSGLWTWCPFRATVVFLYPDEFCGRHGVALPSIQIVKDDCQDLIICDYFLDDTSRRGCKGHVVNMRRVCGRIRGEILTRVKPPTATQLRVREKQRNALHLIVSG